MTHLPQPTDNARLWYVITPFSVSTGVSWIPAHIRRDDLQFATVPATYRHDRSREFTNSHQWLDYFKQAWRGSQFVTGSRGRVGYLTCFPQLAVCTGILKRLGFSRAPFVAWCFNMGKVYPGWKGRLARFALRSADYIIVHSTAEIDIYSSWLNLPAERFIYVPLSIEPFDPPTAKIEGPHYILAMGTANRDYRTLLTAVSPLNIRTIIIAGKHALAGLEIPSQVEIYHDLTLAQCHAFAQSARINVIPIADETAASGQVTMLETMLLGRPVIATDCAGTRDYLIPENNALLVPPQDAPALRREIERLWNDPERGDMLGENGRLFVRTNALVSAVASRMAEILIKAGEVRHPRR